MRLRKVKGAKKKINSYKEFILDDQTNNPIDLETLFKQNQPVYLEIGIGKGKFIYEHAKNNPHINYLGIEKYTSVIVRALEKQLEEPLDNLYLIRTDAKDLNDLFKQNSFSRLYLNFSDPWPKNRHRKRRLTHKNFLKMYEKLLVKEAELHFKTDNIDLFEFSVEELEAYPMNMLYISRDYHSEYENEIVTTEFEKRFKKQGKKIHKLTAKFKEELNG
ncbi:MAG: tRNA (guanosine(46)-N7)-methyltransferase TrmB [Candidatus Izimaplasma sp.]|nr:tRNA (guanosine(46)-N7)-methyltransferase TrmB [Candidatus Izimaplasma bacterium]